MNSWFSKVDNDLNQKTVEPLYNALSETMNFAISSADPNTTAAQDFPELSLEIMNRLADYQY